MRIAMLGSGAWGTALADLLCENGHAVTMWTRSVKRAAEMAETRKIPGSKEWSFIRN